MKNHKFVYFTLVVALFCSCLTVFGQEVGQLKSSDKEVREQALEWVVERGPLMFGPLFQRVGSENVIENKYVKRAIQKIVFTATKPNAEKMRQEVEEELINILWGSFSDEAKRYAIEMLSFGGREKAANRLASFLEKEDFREMARWSLERIPSTAATHVLVDAAHGETDPEWASALIKTLGQRGDVEGLEPVLVGMLSPNEDIRLTSLAAAGRILHPKTESTIMRRVKDAEGHEKLVATNSALLLAEGWMEKGQKDRAEQIYRWFYEEEKDPHYRSAGLAGIAQVLKEDAVDELLVSLQSDSPRILGVAKDYLQTLPGEEITQQLVEKLKSTAMDERVGMISLIAERKDQAVQNATPHLLESVREGDDKVQQAAVQALSQIPGKKTTQAIMEVLESAPQKEKNLFLDILGERGDSEALPLVYEYARSEDPELSVAAFGTISEIGDHKAVDLIREALDASDSQVREAAVGAVVRVAIALEKADQKQEAIDLCIAAAKATKSFDNLSPIAEQLASMGETEFLASMAKKKGCVVNWFIAGPLPSEDHLPEQDYVDPASVDLSQPVKRNGESLDWEFVQITDPHGHVELDKEVANQSNIAAYLYAELESSEEQDGVFHIGSDDGFYCWLNGEQIGEFTGSRAWSPDQNQLDVTMDKGTNSILLLIVNGGGEWGASLQITDTEGEPLVFDQKKN